jgi:hypothetical protein
MIGGNEAADPRVQTDWPDSSNDQYPFLRHDVQVVWWFTGFHPDYHQGTDAVEKINVDKMVRILKLTYASGFHFADSPDVPALVGRVMAKP